VRAETKADELQLSVVYAIDQYKIWFNVAVATLIIATRERMIMERRRKRLLGAEKIYDACDFPQIFATLDRSL
jgi:hypothetical protein